MSGNSIFTRLPVHSVSLDNFGNKTIKDSYFETLRSNDDINPGMV